MPIEYTIIISVISVACTILGVSIGMSNLRRGQKADDQREGATLADVAATLRHMGEHVSSIRHDMASIKGDIKEQHERVVRVEESTKSAHRRLDELAGRRSVGAGE